MVLIKSPLLSQSASGSIGENLTFSLRATGQQARFQKRQSDKQSIARSVQRSLYSEAYHEWNLLSNDDKLMWRRMAYSRHLTGYNLFLQSYLLFASARAYYGTSVFGVTLYGNA